eukprot:2308113-Rhodomonas_salina.2
MNGRPPPKQQSRTSPLDANMLAIVTRASSRTCGQTGARGLGGAEAQRRGQRLQKTQPCRPTAQ